VFVLRIAICEDDQTIQNKLQEHIEDWAEARGTKVDILSYPSAEAFLMAWPEMSFDLAFFDIKMKEMTGIELASLIRKTDSNMLIVFTTSFTQYALSGYEVNAMHYLIKPVSPTKLLPILDKARLIWRSHQDSFMLVSDGTGQLKLPFGDIYYISVLSHTMSVTTDSTVYEMRKTMGELMEMLPSYFIRIHRSFIVNLFKVECVYKDSLLLTNEAKLPISRNNSKDVNDAFIRLHIGR